MEGTYLFGFTPQENFEGSKNKKVQRSSQQRKGCKPHYVAGSNHHYSVHADSHYSHLELEELPQCTRANQNLEV
jgi:hypothetical protein